MKADCLRLLCVVLICSSLSWMATGRFALSNPSDVVRLPIQQGHGENVSLGFVDAQCKWVIEPRFTATLGFKDGLAVVESGGLWGMIDPEGKEVLPIQYQDLNAFAEDLALAKGQEGGYRYIDRKGNVVLDLSSFGDSAYFRNFSEGLAGISIDEKAGFIDKAGNLVVPLKYEYVHNFSEGLSLVKFGGKWGYIDSSGKFMIEPQFDNAMVFEDGVAYFRLDGKEGFIDKSGRVVIEPKYDSVHSFSEGLALVQLDGKWGYIDRTGKMVIEPQFTGNVNWGDFSEGLAGMEDPATGLKGYIDKTGHFVIAPQFNVTPAFKNGLADVDRKLMVEENGKSRQVGFEYGCLNKSGQVVWLTKYYWETKSPKN